MGAKTKIDWCDSTWNPVTGCLHDCPYCYARRIAERFGGCWRLDLPPDTSWRGNVGVRELMGDYARHSNGKCHVLDEPEIECDVIDPPSGYRGKVKPYPYSFDSTATSWASRSAGKSRAIFLYAQWQICLATGCRMSGSRRCLRRAKPRRSINICS